MGRLDAQVQIRGNRVELAEVEAALTAHPSIDHCVALAHGEETGPLRLVAWLVGEPIPVDALRSFALELLPDYMIPSGFMWLDAIPFTPNGKVDRAALPAPDLSREALSAGFVAPPGLQRDPAALLRLVREARISVLQTVPSMLRMACSTV